MKLIIKNGCVEVKGKIYKYGDILEVGDKRAKKLIEDGFCLEYGEQFILNDAPVVLDLIESQPQAQKGTKK